MDKVRVAYNGKEIEKEEVVPGIVKSGNAFLVKCSVTNDWTYCNQERLDKLVAKFKTLEILGQTYVGRAGKAKQKADTIS